MGILEIFQQGEKASSKETVLGKAECAVNNLGSIFLGMAQSLEMANPGSLTSKSAKGIKITKKGNVYTLTLLMYNPPVTVSWTGPMSMDKLTQILMKITEDNKKIGYLNTVNTQNGQFFQLAIA